MADTVQFRYSKKAGFAGIIILLIASLLLSNTGINNYRAHDMFGAIIFGVFATLILVVMVIMVFARLIPALKGEIALELDENGAKDYIRNIVLDWKDVEDIFLKPGRSSAMLIFELKFESDFGKRVAVSLRWVEGRDSEIFDTVIGYFDEAEGIIRE